MNGPLHLGTSRLGSRASVGERALNLIHHTRRALLGHSGHEVDRDGDDDRSHEIRQEHVLYH